MSHQIYIQLSFLDHMIKSQWITRWYPWKLNWNFEVASSSFMFSITGLYVIGYWKTDQIVTLGLFHSIGPPDSYTRTLSMHCCIDRLSWLVYFTGADFADHVKSRLRQWGPWRGLDGRYGSHFHPCVSKTSLKTLQACLGLWVVASSWTNSYSKWSCWKL